MENKSKLAVIPLYKPNAPEELGGFSLQGVHTTGTESTLINSNDNKLFRFKKGTLVANIVSATVSTVRLSIPEDWEPFSPENPVNLKVIICSPTHRRLDPPNMYPSVKPFIDGLVRGGLATDDNWKVFPELTFTYGGVTKDKMFHIDLTWSKIKEKRKNNGKK